MKILFNENIIFKSLNTNIVKKMLVMFLVFTMFFNGFVPKSQDVKNNFVLALGCVVHSVVFEIFSQCTDALTVISNKIADELTLLLTAQEPSTKQQKEESDNQIPAVPQNTSSDSGIIIEKTIEIESQFSIVKNTVNYISYVAIEQLYRLYNNIKVACNSNIVTSNIAILFFMMFSIYISRRKDIIDSNILKIILCNGKLAWVK